MRHLWSVAICGLSAIGCDPVRTTLQPVELRVITPSSGRAVADAKVELKAFYRGVTPSLHEPTDGQWPDRPPIHAGVTDAAGRARIAIKYTAIDRSIGNEPADWRDWVTGRKYSCRVAREGMREVLGLTMQPGASVRGESFAVSVIEVGQPRYVPTD